MQFISSTVDICKLTLFFLCIIFFKLVSSMHFVVTKWAEPEVKQYSNIEVGTGYSSDSQQVVSQICYNATIASTSAQQGYFHLDTHLSFSDLENKLGISVSVSGHYRMFSAEAKASYLRSVQDQDCSLSLNYYEFASNNVALQLAGYGEKALTESGKEFYQGRKNKYFGLICGNQFLKEYQQGALLTMGLNIKFRSAIAKKEFEEKAGVSFFGHLLSAAESVQSIVTQLKIDGSVVIQAFQMGGDPSLLADILNKDSSGHYYVLTCTLDTMDPCIKAASGLLDYAKVKFSKQFSFQNNTGLTPLGISFSKFMPIEYLGLTPPASLVTSTVVKYRYELASRLKENEYYQQKLYSFLNGYPVALHDDFINNANSILSRANSNVAALMQVHEGAADCFNFPDKCKTVKAVIDSQLQNIATSDLKFVESMKYTIITAGGKFYNTGSGNAPGSPQWIAIPDNKPGKEINLARVNNFTITDTIYSYNVEAHWPDASDLYDIHYEGHLNRSWMSYVGTLCFKPKGSAEYEPCHDNYMQEKDISPFFFDAFNK